MRSRIEWLPPFHTGMNVHGLTAGNASRVTGNGRIDEWIRLHQPSLLLALVAVGALLRVVLAVEAPTAYGYVYDFYHETVQRLYRTGRLPNSTDCWQCYHPPLFPLITLPFYALGRAFTRGPGGLADPALRFVTPVALVCGGFVAYHSYRILRFFRFTGTELVIGTGLILGFPCLFISSYGIEADILLNALMVAFLYHLLRFQTGRHAGRTGEAAIVGSLAGLACATKYTGLLAPVILVAVTLLRIPHSRKRWHLVRGTVMALVLCAAVGSWKYLDNIKQHGTLLFANGSAQQGFAVGERPLFLDKYEFHTLRLGALYQLTTGAAPAAPLTELPVYRSVWTTLHAMAWGDMSFFSERSRHGFHRKPYPRKRIAPALALAVLILGLLPGVLAAVGFVTTGAHVTLRPLAIACVLTLLAYAAWFIAQESWALKTKYILYLLPAYVVYALYGVRSLRRLSPYGARTVYGALAVLVVLAHLFLLDFAWS